MSTEWNAILLLDEADILIERRSTRDFERNRLVSGNATYFWILMEGSLTAIQYALALSNVWNGFSF
jgi:hypothetical protein